MRDETVDLWALDEVHFQQQGSRCRMWIPPETRDPVVYHHPTRKSVGYFAAVRLRDGRLLFRRETGRFNGESFREFLQQFREASRATSRRVIAISDNAQYHRSRLHLSWRQRQAPQFRLDFLPPYSPELNPIERVWKLTRRLCLHNRYFGFLDSVVEAVRLNSFPVAVRPGRYCRKAASPSLGEPPFYRRESLWSRDHQQSRHGVDRARSNSNGKDR
jgi:transposase